MTLLSDIRAYVIFKKHGPLLRQLPNQGLQLTFEGRIFVLTFLIAKDYLKKSDFRKVICGDDPTRVEMVTPDEVFRQMGGLFQKAAEKWLADVEKVAKEKPEALVEPTDLTYRDMGWLMWALIQGQRHVEEAMPNDVVRST